MNFPDAIVMQCRVRAQSFIAFSSLAAKTLSGAELPEVTGWTQSPDLVFRPSSIEKSLEAIRGLTGSYLPSITWEFSQGSTLYVRYDPSTGLGLMYVNFIPLPSSRDSVLSLVGKLVDYARIILELGEVTEGELFRQGGGAETLPAVPLVPPRAYAVVVTRALVAEHYEDVDGFFNSGWEQIEPYGDRLLLLRALSAASGAEFLAAVQQQQRALARLAKPGRTIYGGQESPDPEERAVYHSGPPRLRLTGYLEPEQTLVFTCTLEPHEHIQGWEIDRLHKILAAGKLDDGRLIREARLIFPDEASAQREKRPLLDVGAKVQYLDENGDHLSL